MARRLVAVVAALVLLVEAVGFVALNGIMAAFVDAQEMSLAGLETDAMVAGTWAMGIATGLFLALCGGTLALAGLRDRAPGRITRILLISCAVTHGVLGSLTVGLVGWYAFGFMMVVLALVVASLIAYGKEREPLAPTPEDRPGAAPTNGAAPA
ncbi:hypothetical protein [Streptomyces sp. NPDC002889]|uniref:hypothetical protein n=1 Tax=Streptomyces sp. NPDC002889 TaxID=3364669 RepID=UPI00369959E4